MSANLRGFVFQWLNENQRKQLDQVLEWGEKIAPYVTPIMAILLIYYMYNLGPQLIESRSRRAELQFYTFILIWVGLTSSWNIISGYTGYIDFGHTFFFGIGTYVTARFMALVFDMSFWQTLPFAFLIGALLGGVLGLPALRLKGPYFAIAMLGVLVAGRELARTAKSITNGGEIGRASCRE